jgi:hypothetical protein
VGENIWIKEIATGKGVKIIQLSRNIIYLMKLARHAVRVEKIEIRIRLYSEKLNRKYHLEDLEIEGILKKKVCGRGMEQG